MIRGYKQQMNLKILLVFETSDRPQLWNKSIIGEGISVLQGSMFIQRKGL